jgi:hypothetical protein
MARRASDYFRFTSRPITSPVEACGQQSCDNIERGIAMTKRERFVTPVTCPECALNALRDVGRESTWELRNDNQKHIRRFQDQRRKRDLLR